MKFVITLLLSVALVSGLVVPPQTAVSETKMYCVYFNQTTKEATVVATSLPLQEEEQGNEAGAGTDVRCAASAEGVEASAQGTYQRGMNRTGWNVLNVTTLVTTVKQQRGTTMEGESDADFEDNNAQAFSAGFLEGVASYQELAWWYQNNFGPGGKPGKLLNKQIDQYVETHIQWLHTTSRALERGGGGDPGQTNNGTWRNIALLYRQTEGMLAGANYEAEQRGGLDRGFRNFTQLEFWRMLAMTDITSDLSPMFPNNQRGVNRSGFDIISQKLRCTGLVAVSPDLSNIFFGHTTWMRYNTMMRIYKIFTLNFQNVPGFEAKTIQFSSYPGTLSSTDDFYVLDNGFVVIETSLYMWNTSLYANNQPQQLFSNLRTMLANRMVTSGQQWAETFAFLNSGTYNNQWMVVNLNLFTPGEDLQPNTLWIVEQLPGQVVAADQTTILSFGHWPSYNIPFYPEVYKAAGYIPHRKINPEFFDYQNCARAKIFRAVADNISTVEEMQSVMRYNHFREVSPPIDPWYAVAARGDLMPAALTAKGLGKRDASGGLDSKVGDAVSYRLNKTVRVISSPTYDSGLPVFSFDTVDLPESEVCPTLGLPRTFNFTWQEFHP